MAHEKLPHHHGEKSEEVFEKIPPNEAFSQIAEVFSLLGDKTRAKIFWILSNCEDCVINISAMTEMSSPAVMHHLKLLKMAGLIVSRREGKEVYYKAAETQTSKMLYKALDDLMNLT